MDLAMEVSTPGHRTHTYRVSPHRALRTAHSTIQQFVILFVRTVHPPWVLTTASPIGPHHACHLVMCAGGLDNARNPESQPLDTLYNLINALMCCRIAQIATQRHIDGAGAA